MVTPRRSLLILLILGFFHTTPTRCPEILATIFNEATPDTPGNFVKVTWTEQAPHDHIKDPCDSIVYMEASVRLRGDLCRSCGTYYGAFFNSTPRCGYKIETFSTPEAEDPAHLLCRVFTTNSHTLPTPTHAPEDGEEILNWIGTTKLDEIEKISGLYRSYLLTNSEKFHWSKCSTGTFFGRILHK